MKNTQKHEHMLAAATEAASYATAAAKAAMEAVLAVTRANETKVLPAETRPFAEVVVPVVDHGAPRRGKSFFSLGRVHFPCPACRRQTVLPRSLRGKHVSCPKCYTAIRVPDPRSGLAAQNLGRTLQPLLDPSAFAHCVDARNLVSWLVGRLPGAGAVLAAAGAVVLLAGAAALAPVTLKWASLDRIAALQHPAQDSGVAPLASPATLTEAAERIVRDFLDASTPEAKAALVVDGAVAAPWIADWEARYPGAKSGRATIADTSHGFAAEPGNSLPMSEVTVEFSDACPVTYVVEHRPGGPRIAWQESVGFSPVSWQALVSGPARRAPEPFRVLACLDDYYNFAFAAEQDFYCIRLHDPVTRERLGYGYLPRTSDLTASLPGVLPDAADGRLFPVTVSLLSGKASHATGQTQIVGPVTPGWKVRPPAALASL